jgi:hypothetical protein
MKTARTIFALARGASRPWGDNIERGRTTMTKLILTSIACAMLLLAAGTVPAPT